MEYRLCFIGDSITAGTGDETFVGWPARAAQNLAGQNSELTIYNLGVRTDTTSHIMQRWLSEAKTRLSVPLVKNGIICAFGVNDAAIENNLAVRVELDLSVKNARSILTDAKKLFNIFWIGPIPVIDEMQPFKGPTTTYHFNNRRIGLYNERYVQLARELDVPYLDLFSKLITSEQWRSSQQRGDGVHPDSQGYAEIVSIVLKWQPLKDFINPRGDSQSIDLENVRSGT